MNDVQQRWHYKKNKFIAIDVLIICNIFSIPFVIHAE